MDVVPDVAHSWEVLEDGRKYIFHLRDDVCWNDGVPTTAHDFVYAWKRVLDPATGSPNAQLLYDIRGARDVHQGRKAPDEVGIHAPDEGTLVVELEEPTGYFLSLVAQCATFPVPRHVVQAHGHAWAAPQHILTNGAFLLESWQPDASMTLLRDPGYHGRSQGNVERVERRVRPGDAESLLQLYGENTLDTIGLQVDDVGQIPDEFAQEYVCSPLLWTEYAGFNVSLPPFDDLRVRRAFVLAVDRERLAKEILQDRVAPATGGFLPLGMPGHARGIGLPYDPQQARRLLAEAGYPGGRGFPTVEALMHRPRRVHSEHLHEQWLENLGIRVEWREMVWSELVERLRANPPHVFLMGWVADYPDPDNFLRVGFWRERVKWANESYDVLVEQAKRVADQERRMRLYSQADRILTQDAAILPLTYGRRHTLIKPWVKVPVSSFGRTWLWKDIVIESHEST
jgi:ABC-type oligopeptide transport system substrate-binding subunit